MNAQFHPADSCSVSRVGRLLLIINVDWYFALHWLERAEAAALQGWDVHVAAEITDAQVVERIRKLGIRFYRLPLSRKSINPLREAKALFAINRLIKKIEPDCLHLVTMKAVLYGGFWGRLKDLPAVFSLPGLGGGFNEGGFIQRFWRVIFAGGYRWVFAMHRARVLVENKDDLSLLVSSRIASESKVQWIPGAGINLDQYRLVPEPATAKVRVLFAARLYRNKGLEELIAAVETLVSDGVPVELWVAGIFDPDTRGAYTQAEIAQLLDRHFVRWLGRVEDMAGLMRDVHIVCQPSRVREGLPRVLIEGAASGRPLLATDVPGCREIAIDQLTGLLVSPSDSLALAAALRRLVHDSELRRSLGVAARTLVEENFCGERVITQTLNTYQQVLA